MIQVVFFHGYNTFPECNWASFKTSDMIMDECDNFVSLNHDDLRPHGEHLQKRLLPLKRWLLSHYSRDSWWWRPVKKPPWIVGFDHEACPRKRQFKWGKWWYWILMDFVGALLANPFEHDPGESGCVSLTFALTCPLVDVHHVEPCFVKSSPWVVSHLPSLNLMLI